MTTNDKPRSRKDDVVLQELEGEVLIYDLKVDKAFCLNRTSALVWQACDGKRTIAEIGDVVGRELNSKVDQDIIWLALDQLSRENLLESGALNGPFESGISRRNVLKRIGIASAVALPVIASLIAPLPVSAQSCIPNNSVCTASVQCCSMCCKNVGGGINECKPGGGACLP